MIDTHLEADFVYYTLASVATLLVVILGWRVLSAKEAQEDGKNKDDKDNKEDIPDQLASSPTEEDLADVNSLLIKASEIEVIDPKDIKDLQQANGDQPSSQSGKNVRVRAAQLEEELRKKMTADQIDEERRVREQQLAAIFQLMQNNEERFGVDSMEDVKSQYKLYA